MQKIDLINQIEIQKQEFDQEREKMKGLVVRIEFLRCVTNFSNIQSMNSFLKGFYKL